MKVLVCGGRDFGTVSSGADPERVKEQRRLMDMVLSKIGGISKIVHGNAKGADWLAGKWAEKNKIHHTGDTYSADWGTFGKAAGMIRNKRMLDEESPDLVVAFPGGRGTEGMVKISKAAGVRVISVKEESQEPI